MPVIDSAVRFVLAVLVAFALVLTGCPQAANDDKASSNVGAPDRGEMKSEAPGEGAVALAEPAPAMMDEAKEGKGGGGGADGDGRGGAKDPEATWKRSVALANTSKLMVGDDKELPLQGMHLRSQVDGFRARVLIDFYFLNPDDQAYEGTFKLRLPDGASPMFLAFGQSAWETTEPKYEDAKTVRGQGYEPSQVMEQRKESWIDPKVARMVQRTKAAQAYGATVRRAIDPALMEWAGAGVFNARIFPITPKKLHRVVIAYDMDLTPIGDDLELQLPIPEGLASATMDLNIAKPSGVKVSVSPDGEKFPEGDRQFHRLEGISGKTVEIRLKGANRVALTGKDDAVGPFFAAAITPEAGRSAPGGSAKPAVFVVDTSMSSNPDRFNVWLSLMRAILENNRKEIPEFAVLFFNVDANWWRTELVANEAAQVDAVMKHAETLALEGATDLAAALGEAARPSFLSDAAFDVFLLSDGAATWGPADRWAISKTLDESKMAALYAYKTGMAGGDTGMLDHLARESGGAVFSVVGESEIATASKAHTARPWTIENVALDGANDLMLAGRPSVLFPGQRLFLVGRGAPTKGAEVVLTLGQNGKTSTVSTSLSAVLESDLTPRSYGQIAVDQLEDLVEVTEPIATAYARHFRVTGKTASLLMLESEEEYRAYGIEPKADASVIAGNPAAKLVVDSLAQVATRLGDPKAAFMYRLGQLKDMPGVMLAMPEDLRTILDGLPSSAFAVHSVPLKVKQHAREGIEKQLFEQLAKQAPEYDVVTQDAERRLSAQGPDDALAALSSLVEANPGDGVLARDIGFSAMQWGLHAQAYQLFTRVADARPYEPQTYRAMAMSLAAADQRELALAYFELALAGQWDARFGEFRQILLQDYVRFLGTDPGAKLAAPLADYARTRVKTLREQVGTTEADVLVTITWNTDNTDVDLHVIEPSGEECFYAHNKTASGGALTRDVTQGYGPEMYVLPKAPEGKYVVRAKYFASDANRASARTKVYATITRNWGKPGEKTEERVVTLELGKEMHDLLTVAVP